MKKCFLTKARPQTRMLGRTGLAVSCVGIGVLPMGPGQLDLPLDEGASVICDALRRGINFIDTAQYYRTYPYIRRALEVMRLVTEENPRGADNLSTEENPCGAVVPVSSENLCGAIASVPSENLCGAASPAMRGKMDASARDDSEIEFCPQVACDDRPHRSDMLRPVISSKSLASSYADMMAAIEECRSALGLKTIDIFLMHEVRTGQFAARAGAWQALQDARATGLVRAIGISTHHADVARAMADIAACDVIFALLNYRGMGIRCGQDAGTKEEMAAALTVCKAAGKGIYLMKALGGGNLTGDYQKALDYVFTQDFMDAVMVGFTNTSEIDDMMCYLSGTMESSYNPDVSRKKMYVNQEDCEGCGACLKICAAGAVHYNKNGLAEIDQSKCLTCGYCAQGCPVRAIIMY